MTVTIRLLLRREGERAHSKSEVLRVTSSNRNRVAGTLGLRVTFRLTLVKHYVVTR